MWATLPTVYTSPWSATNWKHLYAAHFDENFLYDQSNPKIWALGIFGVSGAIRLEPSGQGLGMCWWIRCTRLVRSRCG